MSYREIQKLYKNRLDLPFTPFYSDEQYNDIRRLKVIILSSILLDYNEFTDLTYENQIDIILHIENSCANETIRKSRGYNLRCVWTNEQFISIYHIICCNIISILDQENTNLIKKIINNEIDLNTIANLSCRELSPEKYDDITQIINKRINIEQTIKCTEMHFCKKCKRNQTTAERVQNRSNDEASSFLITCVFCGTKWFK